MIMAYLYDFISSVFEKDIKDEIKNIVLYGSVASGKFDEESDIDLFVEIWDIKKRKIIEKKIKEQLGKFEDRAARMWYPRGIKNRFSIIVGDLASSEWETIKHDMISNGILLYGKFEKIPEKMRHMVLITFSLTKLRQPEKMKLIRDLYGYESKKKGKKYKKSGLIDAYGGLKASSNSILIPIEKMHEFRKLFTKFRITPEIREIWLKQ